MVQCMSQSTTKTEKVYPGPRSTDMSPRCLLTLKALPMTGLSLQSSSVPAWVCLPIDPLCDLCKYLWFSHINFSIYTMLWQPKRRPSNAHSLSDRGLEEKLGLRRSVHGSCQLKRLLRLKQSLYCILLFQFKQHKRFHILYLPWFLSLEIIPLQPPPSCPFW